MVDAHSGTAGIAAWVNSYYKLTGKDRIDKRHPGIAKIKNGLIPNTQVAGPRLSGTRSWQQVKLHLRRVLTLRESRSE